MKWFFGFLIFCVIGVLAIQKHQGSGTHILMGVARSDIQFISNGADAEIKQIKVRPGNELKKGDTLLILARPELEQKIAEFTGLLEGEKGKQTVRQLEISREKVQIQNRYRTQENELRTELDKKLAQFKSNRSLSASLGVSANENDSTKGVLFEIKTLKNALENLEQNLNNEIKALSLQTSGNVSYTKDYLLESIERLKEEKKSLVMTAPFDGVVSNVLKMNGDKLAAFETVLLLSKQNPSRVHAYLFEEEEGSLKPGDSVLVQSISLTKKSTARVIGLGKEYVELPNRLKKIPEQILWGRELVLELGENSFLNNEKVEVVLP